jgi:WD40 repeat protein
MKYLFHIMRESFICIGLMIIIVTHSFSQFLKNDIEKNISIFTDSYHGWEGHSSGFVYSIDFNNDYTAFVTGGTDHCVRLWDASNYTLKKVFLGHNGYVISAVFSLDGKKIASGSIDKTMKIWNVTDGSLINTINMYPYNPEKIVFSPDGAIIACANCDNIYTKWDITLYSVADGSIIRNLSWDKSAIYSIVFSSDGNTLIGCSPKKNIYLWDIHSGTLSGTIVTDTGNTSLKLSSDGSRLMVCGIDSIRTYNTSNWNLIKSIKAPESFSSSVFDVSLDESKIALNTRLGHIILMNSDGSLIKKWQAHNDMLSDIKFNQDASIIISSLGKTSFEYDYSTDYTLKAWNSADGSLFMHLPGHTDKVHSISLSPDNEMLATAGEDCHAYLWNGKDATFIKDIIWEYGDVFTVRFSPDSLHLAISDDGKIQIYNTKTGIIEKTLTIDRYNLSTYFDFSPDGKNLISYYGSNVVIWNSNGWKKIKEYPNLASSVQVYSPDGNTFASIEGTMLKIRDIATGNVYKLFNESHVSSGSLSFSKDGKRIASCYSNEIYIWNIDEGILEKKFTAHTGGINCIQFSGNGLLLASAGGEGTIKIWDARNYSLLKTITFDHGYPISICFSNDSKKIYSGGWGYKNIRYYDISDISVGIEEKKEIIPSGIVLYQNYPNPFNPTTIIRFTIGSHNDMQNNVGAHCNAPESVPIKLKIYDILGREIKTLIDGYGEPGLHEVKLDASSISSGIYFYRLTAGRFTEMKKLIYIR